MKFYYISLFLILHSLLANACNSAYQYKIFPIGIQNQNIITLTVNIHRTDFLDNTAEFRGPEIGWNMEYYVSTYNLNGQLISKDKAEKIVIEAEHYLKELTEVFQKKLKSVVSQNKNITLFNPEYISFCDFQKKCNMLTLENNIKKKKDYLIYKSKTTL
ncbi:hypothetical protein ACSIGC_11975 [Tenacibaculum sp. ZS6-P6]|uniref:hypothetical protein n=1 Tax=Tenacibaculum sp. ZS6-P6 TaxID=3447503 RepID=UPI003F962579